MGFSRDSLAEHLLRHVAAIALGVAILAGCDNSSSKTNAAPNARSEAVVAASDMPAASPPGAASVSAAPIGHAAQAPPRILCESELTQPGRRFPKGTFTPIAAPGADLPAERIPAGGGRWTWINLFASWCGPCKEEIPRLRGFAQKLATNLEVAFVSVDDDERSLKQYLDGQAGAGVRSAFWIQPGKSREGWLAAFDLKDPPQLPVQVLLDPTGKVRCVAGGAVEDADFARVAAIVQR
ncbi:MAG: TlpA family protein disulfide reductase [Polyangiaceae bacterium]